MRTVEELKEQYQDSTWRTSFIDVADLMSLLGDCIIADDYVISDALNDALHLSSAGKALTDRLVRKEGVKVKEARLMTALTLGVEDLHFDLDKLDISQLVEAIDREILDGRLRFPSVLGRGLYDRYAELFDEERTYLNMPETLRLLDGMPVGVYQYGRFVTGPYGLKCTQTVRLLTCSLAVPAYHCAVPLCSTVHRTHLQTSWSAPINEQRSRLERILQDSEPAEWWSLSRELAGVDAASYDDRRSGTLHILIGDCLSDKELRTLVAALFGARRLRLREAIADFCVVQDAEVAVAGMNREQLLQICLFVPDADVTSVLDRLVYSGRVHVPVGEVRVPVVNSGKRSGAFQLRAELGHRGVRLAPADRAVALLRERRLLDQLYLRDPDCGGDDVHELEWQLRGVEGESIDEKLETFFQSATPREALVRLVLARKTNMVTACTEVGLEFGDELSDDELIETLLWKLGFADEGGLDPHADFWRKHERIWALAQAAGAQATEEFQAAASAYFKSLEGLLVDALAFTTWALLVDHVQGEHKFRYDDQNDRSSGLVLLQNAHDTFSSSPKKVDFASERVDLADLIEGFRTLAKRLEECADNPGLYQRPTIEYPSFAGKTDLKAFSFRSTVPFVDLDSNSRTRVCAGLNEVTEILVEADVNKVRNEYARFRRTPPEVQRIEVALEAVRVAVTRLETLGFCRVAFVRTGARSDRWGRSRHRFSGPRSFEHELVRPSRFDWMGLPSMSLPQYLMRAASFGDPQEVLRFSPRYLSEFSEMWEGVPARRRRAPGTSASDLGIDAGGPAVSDSGG